MKKTHSPIMWITTVAIWSYYRNVLVCRCQWVAGQHYIAVQCESHGGGRLWVKLSLGGSSGPTRAGPGGAEARQSNA